MNALLNGRRFMMVGGRTTLERDPLRAELINLSMAHGAHAAVKVDANPTFACVAELRDEMKAFAPDVVVAVGGGSPIDAAKAAAMLVFSGGEPRDYFGPQHKTPKGSLPLIAVPTTAGTASEVTPVSVLVDEEQDRKVSCSHPCLFPQAALFDPRLTYTMPATLAASTGLDALCHALESIWSPNCNPVSELHALAALKMIDRYLVASVNGDPAARDKMLFASLQAGLSFSNTGVTAVHPASYPLTVRFGIAHGQACGLFLLPFIGFNWPAIGGHARTVILDAFSCKDADELVLHVEGLMKQAGLWTDFEQAGITADSIDYIARNGIGRSSARNPRPVRTADLAAMLRDRL